MEFLQTLYLYRYRFSLRAVDEIDLPPFKGFALRGVFGTVLRELACGSPSTVCTRCTRQIGCPYVYLFETIPHAGLVDAAKYSSYPRPYVIIPPLDTTTRYRPGDRLSFEIILIGRAVEFFPFIVATFEEVCRRGFRRKGVPGRFSLKAIESLTADDHSRLIYRDGTLNEGGAPVCFSHLHRAWPERNATVKLTFLTPLQLKEQGNLVRKTPPMSLLLEALARRANLLNYLHCGGSFVSSGPFAENSGRNKTLNSNLRWEKLERFSNRQKRRLLQGGLIGEVTYGGETILEYLTLLRLGEIIHLGRSTTFGLGRYRMAAL